ncbi:MAG TPA: CDGSH iron-sulfur domain-containing protein [Casimicrobiaceae bacterium]|jgi:CDGSH-type Zn-finger protein|nr:CDGSH iron-sulfur domain-containing protein [Casimicrobiaceae bacterium]
MVDRPDAAPVRSGARIRIANHGPYLVSGSPQLTTRAPKFDAQGAPVAWTEGAVRKTGATYMLCRCGQSANKPFCDGTHQKVGFAGSCTADRAPGATRRKVYAGAGIVMTDDESLCAGYAFCDPHGSVWSEIEQTADPAIRKRVERQIADCPSGRLQFAPSATAAPVEIPYPPTIATIPDGALWVLGGIPIELSDGFTYEVRNRQLLCRCGASQNKPFCDGSHSRVQFRAP